MLEWAIEDIVAAHPGLYLEHCAVMATALMGRYSDSPCEFAVQCDGVSPPAAQGDRTFPVRIAWTEQTAAKAARVWRAEQRTPVVERAAVALAALAFGKLFPDSQLRVTRRGDRADYWLPNLGCALEVSGTEHARDFDRRHRQKAAQVLQNPLGWNGYVFVCCFARARRAIRWSYHTQKVEIHESP